MTAYAASDDRLIENIVKCKFRKNGIHRRTGKTGLIENIVKCKFVCPSAPLSLVDLINRKHSEM